MADFIKKLQSIDVKDLKNLDYQKILQDVKKRPDIIISSAVVVMALLISINLVSSHFRESQSLRNDIATLERKLSVVEDYKKVRDEMDAFMAQIPAPMAEQDLINILTDIAVKRRVQIES
ncbi:MAG: hypothetical protein U1D99_11275, partial [Candidatus Omnitrophota bacterium]|nr:hypothetical protein [Candidatus Omnitrophota bacterium]